MLITIQSTDDAVLEEMGGRLQRTRLERNVSQARLAEEAGIGEVTLQRIEAGGSASLISLIRVLRALDLLDGLNRLVPEPTPSPIDELKRRGARRKRAGSPRAPQEAAQDSRPWRWGDEKDGGDA